jgi:catechol 2,3-dioxygenase-like lactoylglutathione lyase family enzyme
LNVVEIKAFVPARDMKASLDFYRAIGFEVPWESEDLAYVHFGEASFLLQKFYVAEHAGNFMMHMLVENADDWYQRVLDSGVRERFGSRVEPPEDRPWLLRDFIFVDPTGVLWRIGHNLPVLKGD